jgi:hypothetical protein
MAGQASLFDGNMLEFCFFCRVAKAGMAAEAEFIPVLRQVVLIFCRMRIMAQRAILLNDNLMRTDGILREHGVAFGTYFRRVFVQ